MARTERPWYWTARRAWYVIVSGKRHRLGGEKKAALKRWHEIAAAAAATATASPTPHDRSGTLTVRRLYDLYLAALPAWGGAHCVRTGGARLRCLTAAFGSKRVADVTADDFVAVAKRRRWSSCTAYLTKRRWAAACNWAIQQRLLTENPLRGLRLPKPTRTRRLVLPTPAQTAAVLAAATEPLRDVLEALIDTGCRPSEAFRVTAADLDGDRWRLPTGKNGKPRTVYLTPRVRRRSEQLARRHPTGPLYRRPDGQPWPLDRSDGQRAFQRLRERLRLPAGLTLYSWRHAFATDALARGVPDAVVAELLGHSVAILIKHYAHLRDRGDAVRDALRRVRGDGGS